MAFKGIKNQVSGVGVVVALVFGVLVITAVMMIARMTMYDVPLAPAQSTVQISIANEVFDMEVARTPAAREYGLMNRTELCYSCGMMFVFDEPGVYPFWMKDTPLSLDIVWVRQGLVVAVAAHTIPNSEERINPAVVADRVLEFPAGTIARIGATIGDVVQ